jgi:serine/threonine protein kinase
MQIHRIYCASKPSFSRAIVGATDCAFVGAGVDYLHKNFMTHRDIKPANIILDKAHTTPKLIDFGFTNIFDEVLGPGPPVTTISHPICGM